MRRRPVPTRIVGKRIAQRRETDFALMALDFLKRGVCFMAFDELTQTNWLAMTDRSGRAS